MATEVQEAAKLQQLAHENPDDIELPQGASGSSLKDGFQRLPPRPRPARLWRRRSTIVAM